MSASELARFLARVVLDDELRAMAATDLDRAAEGFALEPRHKDALRRGGPEVLDLLGEAFRAGSAGGDASEAGHLPSAGSGPDVPVEAARRLPRIGLTLRLQPFATGVGDELRLTWAASIVPDGAPEPVVDPAPPGTPLPPLRLRVGVTPVTEQSDEGLRVRFAAEVRPEGAVEVAAPVAATGGTFRYHPWDHRLGSPEVREAAAAVRAAGPGERRERILALIRAMETR